MFPGTVGFLWVDSRTETQWMSRPRGAAAAGSLTVQVFGAARRSVSAHCDGPPGRIPDMPSKRATSESYRETVLKRNNNINTETVAAHEKLERELRKLGVEIKPSFNLEPPLGRSRTGIHNRNG